VDRRFAAVILASYWQLYIIAGDFNSLQKLLHCLLTFKEERHFRSSCVC